MSKVIHHPKAEHGSMKNYVTGFILSLIFTAIPYYLVVEKVITGRALLVTILGIAFIQMMIQIFFFLHLGRGPKPLYNIVFFVGTVGIILVVVVGSIFIMDNLQYNMTPDEVTKKLAQNESISQVGGEETGACQQTKENHKVTITDGKFTPLQIDADLCDTLTFINNDSQNRNIAFGPHPQHGTYTGQDVTVTNRRPKTITLNEAGTFEFHDHLDPGAAGYLTVTD